MDRIDENEATKVFERNLLTGYYYSRSKNQKYFLKQSSVEKNVDFGISKEDIKNPVFNKFLKEM